MGANSWHVQVVCRGEIGAGFLISDRHVMTCAHVVAGDDRADAYFAAHAELGTIGATVVLRGEWAGGAADPGDVAVLELERPVDIRPADFADPQAAYAFPSPKLVSYGFPVGYDEGTLAESRATTRQLSADEWVQLEAWTGYGHALASGFSGAAAVLAESGRVAGMVSAASNEPDVRVGRMLPVQVLARYWPPLADAIPTPGFGTGSKQQLRELLEQAGGLPAEYSLESLYSSAVGPLGPAHLSEGFRSLWDVAWYVMTEVAAAPDRSPVAEFAGCLADRIEDPGIRYRLREWARRHRPEPVARPAAGATAEAGGPARTGARWSPILVEIDRSGADRNTFLVEVSAFRDGCRRVVGTRTLPKGKIRAYVLEQIDEAFRELDRGSEELIAFAVPREWLNQPIDRWHRAKGDATPLGCFSPLVLMDLDRRRSGALQYKIQQKWELLDRESASVVHRIECGSRPDPGKLTVQLRSKHELVGFAAPPAGSGAKRLLEAGLNAAVPIMVWPRLGCAGGHSGEGEGDCQGRAFLDELSQQLVDIRPADLPGHVRQLRERAFVEEGEHPHWAQDLVLLWEDPRWFPEPGDYRRSPVS
ncbi:trypsin-like peptidase domain-containing protein [Kitasatospora sp. GAS1066B]|uniref:VMAP-C domain-containing protein n=1 Tax=Kitasatospora sp. GAS1066B TaxID=3156271 RepID=UPI00351752B3